MCDNIGTAFIDLSIEKGKYKVYYLRIENEQRILSNSRLEVLGSSRQFSISQLNSEYNHPNKESMRNENNISYEESYSYSNQDSQSIYKRKNGSLYS